MGSRLESEHTIASAAELLEDAARFGIACGFTIPIHDGRGPIAVVTFAAEEHRGTAFSRHVEAHKQVLQLMAMYFHSHVRRRLSPDRIIDGVSLSPRETECLEWAAQGKSAWETGTILGISRHTVATYLENAKTKLGVRTIVQAVILAQRDDEDDAILISHDRGTIGKRAALVVGVGPALPVTDGDGAVRTARLRTGWRQRKGHTEEENDGFDGGLHSCYSR
jgi:DNA-binding CsgD family transcriptional regulator